jgi:hypothetical protein
MGGFSNQYAEAVANHFFRGDIPSAQQTRPGELYLSLHVADPTDVGSSGDELEGGSYSRQRIFFGEPNTDFVNNTFVTFIGNSNYIIFPNMPASAITYIGIWTQLSGGDLVFSDNLYISAATPVPVILNNGDTLSIPENYIKIYIR